MRIAVSLERGGNLGICVVRQTGYSWCSVVQKKPLPFRGSLVSRRQFAEAIWRDPKNRSLAKRWRGWVYIPKSSSKVKKHNLHICLHMVFWLSCWILRTLSYTWSHAFLASAISLTPSQVSGRSMRSQASLAAGPRQPLKQYITKGTRRWSRVGSVLEKLENHDY